MKKRLALCLAAALLFLCACAETELPAPSEPEETEPSSEAVQPVQLTEDCKIYSDLAAEEIVYAFDSGRGGEVSYRSGMPESLYAVRGGELEEINVSGMTSDALSVAEAFGESAQQISGEGATCLSWDGNRYICFTIRVEDTELPALTAPTGGILALEVHGDCRMDPGDAEWAALSGFDCVILSGDGTLTLNGGLKTGGTALPALILNGVALAADNTDTATTGDGLAFLQFSGGLRTELLRVQGDLCVTGGELSAGQIFESTVKNAVFRGGTALIGACDASAVETLILSGGTAAFFEPLPAGCAVRAGAGLLCAPGLSGVSGSDGCTVLDADADGTIFYGHLELNEEQLAAQDAAGITQTRFLPVQAAQNLWLSGCLRLENAEVERLTPWSGLWLDAEGESTVGGEEKLGAPALLITGGGKLTLRGGVGLFHHAGARGTGRGVGGQRLRGGEHARHARADRTLRQHRFDTGHPGRAGIRPRQIGGGGADGGRLVRVRLPVDAHHDRAVAGPRDRTGQPDRARGRHFLQGGGATGVTGGAGVGDIVRRDSERGLVRAHARSADGQHVAHDRSALGGAGLRSG